MPSEPEPLSAEEERDVRSRDSFLQWTERNGHLMVKRMTDDWEMPRLDEVDRHRLLATLDAARSATPSSEDWSRLLDYLEVNQPADVDDVIAVLEVRAHRAEKRAATPAWSDAEGLLGGLDEDDVMYDYPVAMSGEPMDPVLFVRWDAVRSALATQSRGLDVEQEAALRADRSLDEAWAEVESALPEGWGLSLEHLPKGGWTAIAGPEDWRWPIESKAVRGEPTATAALRALAARLSEPPQ